MMIVFFKNVLLRYYFFHADDYLHWMMMLEDSGTDFFRLVALWISPVVIVNHILDDLIMYVCMCIHVYKHANGRRLLLCAKLLYLASMSL